MKHYFTQYRYYLRTKGTYIYFVIPILLSILSALYFSSVLESSLIETEQVQPIKNIEFNQSAMKIIKQKHHSISYNTSGPVFDYFYLSCDDVSAFDLLSDCLVLRYDQQPGSVEFKIPKDLMKQEQLPWPRISDPEIYDVYVGSFFHKSIPFEIESESSSSIILRVDVPPDEPVIYVRFKDTCSFLCYDLPLPRASEYTVGIFTVGIFFVTLIVYYVSVWILKKSIAIKAKKPHL